VCVCLLVALFTLGRPLCLPAMCCCQASVKFGDVSRGLTRKQAARGFFELLVLKSWDCIDVQQAAPYADISITKAVRVCA
jgi:hypothetical protein